MSICLLTQVKRHTHSQLNGTIMKIRCFRHISGCQLTYSNFFASIYVVEAKTNLVIYGFYGFDVLLLLKFTIKV